MIDPLAQVVVQLRLSATFSKLLIASGRWRVRRSDNGQPFYCAVLDGGCRLAAAEREVELRAGDFVLIPAAYDFAVSSTEPPGRGSDHQPLEIRPGVFRLGDGAASEVRLLVGHFTFGSPDAALLVSLLPELVHVRGEPRLTTLVSLVNEETRGERPGRDMILARLLEVLMIEAFRSTAGPAAPPGLLRGLADDQVAVALRRMHGEPTRPWTVPQLAKEAALSRSTFFERFRREVGVAPMEYLSAWRMALAKELLGHSAARIATVAGQVGYSSASTFSVAFARHVGVSPGAYAADRRAGGERAGARSHRPKR